MTPKIADTLTGARILIAEDEALVAMELAEGLSDAGAEVIGPLATLPATRRAATGESLDVAILDVDLRGEHVFPAAEILASRGVPFLFHTGNVYYGTIAASFDNAPVFIKPVTTEQLIEVVCEMRRAS